MGRHKSENAMTGYELNKRWRLKHPETRYAGKQRYYDKTKDAVNSRSRYTEEEKEMILDHEIPDSQLAEKLGRSVKAIQEMKYAEQSERISFLKR